MSEYSEYLKINVSDIAKGIAVAVLTAVLQFLYQLVVNNGLNFSQTDFQQLLSVAVLSALGYLSKNLLTDSQGRLVGKIQL
jgi:hypothetical protein